MAAATLERDPFLDTSTGIMHPADGARAPRQALRGIVLRIVAGGWRARWPNPGVATLAADEATSADALVAARHSGSWTWAARHSSRYLSLTEASSSSASASGRSAARTSSRTSA